MLGDQALLLEDVQSQTLLHRAQVGIRDPARLCSREKTKKLLGLSEQVMGGPPGALGVPQSHPSLCITLCRGNLIIHRLQA